MTGRAAFGVRAAGLLLVLPAIGLPALLAGGAAAQAPAAATGTIEGTITVAGPGGVLPDAGVRAELSGGVVLQTVADSAGRFVFRGVEGRVVLTAVAAGHLLLRRTVYVPAGGSVSVALELAPAVVALDEVQVTATPYARDPLAVPQSVTTLSGRTLARERASSLGATLGAQPGIAIRFDGPGAAAPVIRGLSGERIVILHDGQRTGDLAATAPDHAVTIDPGSATRIEIVRGPAALMYGNNAVGGAVNVISGDLPTDAPSQVMGSVLFTGESAARGGGVQVEALSPLGASGALRVRAGGREHGELRVGRAGRSGLGTEGQWAGGARLANSYSSARNASIGAGVRTGNASVALAARGYRFDYGLPHPAGEVPVHLSGDRGELLGRLEVRGGALEGARLEAGAQWYRHDEWEELGVPLTTLGVRSAHLQAVSRTPTVPFSGHGAAGMAVSWRDNDVTGEVALTPANRSYSLGAFLYQELGAEGTGRGVRFPVGLRLDHHAIASESSDRFGPGVSRSFLAVTGSVGVTVPLGADASLGGSVSRAVRAPTAEELFAEAGHAGTGAFEIGDPTLGPERATGGELVLRVRRTAVRGEASAYVNRIAGYIALYPSGRDTVVTDGGGDPRTYPLHIVSQRDARLVGAEGSLWVEATPRVIVGVMGDVLRARDAAGDPLPYMPSARVGSSLRYETPQFSAGVRVRHAFAQWRVPDGEVRAGASTLLDTDAGVHFDAAGRSHMITLRVENARDVAYRDAASRIKAFAPNQGRGLVLSYLLAF